MTNKTVFAVVVAGFVALSASPSAGRADDATMVQHLQEVTAVGGRSACTRRISNAGAQERPVWRIRQWTRCRRPHTDADSPSRLPSRRRRARQLPGPARSICWKIAGVCSAHRLDRGRSATAATTSQAASCGRSCHRPRPALTH